MRLFKQILKEFWIPLLCAILWAGFNLYQDVYIAGRALNVRDLVTIFAPAFFFVSWMTGQFIRVKRQTKVEDSFDRIEKRFSELLTRVEQKTAETINHITGGDSFLHADLANLSDTNNVGRMTLMHHGRYPLYDVTVRIVDLAKFQNAAKNDALADRSYESTFSFKTILSGGCIDLGERNLGSDNAKDYNIFYYTRGGHITEQLRLRKIEGHWLHASKVFHHSYDRVFSESIDEGFPRNENGEVSWQ